MIRLAAYVTVLIAACSLAAAKPLDVPFYRQQKNGCGAASVAMVLNYWSSQRPDTQLVSPAPEDVSRVLYRPEIHGILLADMKRYVEDLKLRAFTLRGEWPDVEGQLAKSRPLIVGLKKKPSGAMHFVVVTGVEGEHVWLNDPTGKKPSRLEQREFEKRWAQAGRWLLLALPER